MGCGYTGQLIICVNGLYNAVWFSGSMCSNGFQGFLLFYGNSVLIPLILFGLIVPLRID